MTLSARNADASAATIESAQIVQMGRSVIRGGRRDGLVDRSSASAGIVTSLPGFELARNILMQV